jgi:hypothetical protein
MRVQKRIIFVLGLIVIGLLFFSYGVGFAKGVSVTIRSAIDILPNFTNISINEQAMRDALFQYKERIGGCIPPRI